LFVSPNAVKLRATASPASATTQSLRGLGGARASRGSTSSRAVAETAVRPPFCPRISPTILPMYASRQVGHPCADRARGLTRVSDVTSSRGIIGSLDHYERLELE
jgi:hypothetical protein